MGRKFRLVTVNLSSEQWGYMNQSQKDKVEQESFKQENDGVRQVPWRNPKTRVREMNDHPAKWKDLNETEKIRVVDERVA